MPSLVSLDDLKLYLGDAPASSDDDLLTELIDNVEALFASETGRNLSDYVAAGDRVEVRDGTGSPDLYLDYPIDEDGLTSVKIGYDSAAPDETLSTTDRTVLVYGEGSRLVSRVDGGTWGIGGERRFIEVEYDHLGNLAESAYLAIKEVVAAAYRQRGSEGMQSETVGSFYSYTRADVEAMAGQNSHWQAAVNVNRAWGIL